MALNAEDAILAAAAAYRYIIVENDIVVQIFWGILQKMMWTH
jgi:hypothetical protein